MRTISSYTVAIQALGLALLFSQYASPDVVVLGLLLLVLGVYLATMSARWSLVVNTLIAALLWGATAGLAAAQLLLAGWQVLLLTLAAGTFPIGVATYLGTRMQRVWKGELVVLFNPLFGGLTRLAGPMYILPLPLTTLRARIPLGRLSAKFELEHVNTQPRAGPLVPLTQNLRRVKLEVKFHLLPSCYALLFAMPDKAELFTAAAEKVGKPVPVAMEGHYFWVTATRALLERLVDSALREEALNSRLGPHDLAVGREQLAAAVRQRLEPELAVLGVCLTGCLILDAEPDETAAALQSREAMLMAQSRSVELQLVGDALTELIERVVTLSRKLELPVPMAAIETLLQGVLPNGAPVTRIRSEPGPHVESAAHPARPAWSTSRTITAATRERDKSAKQAA